ncbi:HAD-IIB family hydrolase [Demequina pelophila]|uniref:HAD-IIB family hydrolase n=1 Tax=Demequina pelophila TaxID=1638984 RepID=UPI000786797E|nr:HAD-IIB family hydrolase [Demequina pelophila]
MTTTHTDRRAIFLDIDGTYADHGEVPEAHADAVRAARRAGHAVLLCTGRPRPMIPAHILEAGFDGVVASAGAHVEIDGQVLLDRRFPEDLAARTRETLDAHGTTYVLEAPDANYALPHARRTLMELMSERWRRGGDAAPTRGPQDVLASILAAESLEGISFAKITTFAGRTPLAQVALEIGPEVAAIPSSIPEMGDGAGELYLSDIHKAVGMAIALAHLGFEHEASVAFGDGLNDLEMLASAGIGVAIADAEPRVIAAADRVCAGPATSGLATAFAELGLLDT